MPFGNHGRVIRGKPLDSGCFADSSCPTGPAVTVAAERERFLGNHGSPLAVREEIAFSWKRCSSWHVQPEGAEPPYDPDSRLNRAAAPVLDKLSGQLSRTGLSFLLTDSRARIIERRVTDRELLGRLDAVRADRGFVFAEEAMGTNGHGTAVEAGRVTEIVGAEHYAEELRQFR